MSTCNLQLWYFYSYFLLSLIVVIIGCLNWKVDVWNWSWILSMAHIIKLVSCGPDWVVQIYGRSSIWDFFDLTQPQQASDKKIENWKEFLLNFCILIFHHELLSNFWASNAVLAKLLSWNKCLGQPRALGWLWVTNFSSNFSPPIIHQTLVS